MPPPRQNFKNFPGFTLAEILITLGIIGIVAALTVPMFVERYREKVIVNKLKKFYSSYSQAFAMAVAENGTVDTWGLIDREPLVDGGDTAATIENNKKFTETILAYYKGDKKYIWQSQTYRLTDGTHISLPNNFYPTTCTSNKKACGGIHVFLETTDRRTPIHQNFGFTVYRDKIVPVGANMTETDDRNCKSNHFHCTAWVLYNENLDYLHCPDKIGWNKARSCKEAAQKK